MVDSLFNHLKTIPDHRRKNSVKHDLAETLTCLIAGFMNGRTPVGRALEWSRNHLKMLQKNMDLKNGISSEPTVSRIMSSLDEQMFTLVFMEWVAEIISMHGIQIAIVGKALRGGTEKIKGGNVPYVLNAIDVVTEMVLAQIPIAEKTNEITSIPKLLEFLEIRDNVFTIDAIGTQKKIEERIVENGGHFVLQVKKNNPILYQEIVEEFDSFDEEMKKEPSEWPDNLKPYLQRIDKWEKSEKNRERLEYREVIACMNSSFLDCVEKGENTCIRSVARLTQVRVPKEKDADGNDITVSREEFLRNGTARKPKPTKGDDMRDDEYVVGLVSDLEIGAEAFATYKRLHWKIENNLQHVLDDLFREDRSSARKSKNNLALIRKFDSSVKSA